MDIREEIENLAMNFEACHKTLAAMGDETRQHIILEMMHIDPALASSVFVTTVTDCLGFFFFLGLATLTMPLLM